MDKQMEINQIQDAQKTGVIHRVPTGMSNVPYGCTKPLFNNGPFTFFFGTAIQALKAGKKVGRTGWNEKGMWLELSEYGPGAMYKDRPLHPHILMATAQGDYVPWLASQTDMLAEDWVVVN